MFFLSNRIKRVNYLFKDKNPNFKNGKFEWRKNNTLVIGKIRKIFDKENRLIELEFEKLSDLVPFHNSFDCEMTPDYMDGGHGIQVCINYFFCQLIRENWSN